MARDIKLFVLVVLEPLISYHPAPSSIDEFVGNLGSSFNMISSDMHSVSSGRDGVAGVVYFGEHLVNLLLVVNDVIAQDRGGDSPLQRDKLVLSR